MHVVIMGCGRVGSSLARSMERRGHSVAVIDVAASAFRRLGPRFRGKTIEGVGYDRSVLEEAGIERASGFAAVSSGDNSNILAARVVRETYGISNVVARIYDQGRAEVYERLGVPSVATVRWASDQILRRLLPEGSEPLWRDPTGAVRLVQVATHPDWIGHRVEELEKASRTVIPFITRFGVGMVPERKTVIQDGDLVYAAVANANVVATESVFSQPPVID